MTWDEWREAIEALKRWGANAMTDERAKASVRIEGNEVMVRFERLIRGAMFTHEYALTQDEAFALQCQLGAAYHQLPQEELQLRSAIQSWRDREAML